MGIEDPQQPELSFRIEVPGDLQNGAYANFCSVWNSPHEFTLDFGVTGQPERSEDGQLVVPTRVVARIKIPLTIAQELLAAVARQVSAYEAAAGPIRKPGEDTPMFPPEDLR